ncbi:SPASM domain-containing protein [Hominilimicola sp.]
MTLKGYENLKKYNIIPGTIAVVGKHNINNLIDVYEYFRNKNQPLKLNTIFASGSAKENEDILLTDPEYYAEKICELFDLWLFDTTTGISISPFYSYAQSVISGKPKYCTHSSCLKHWLSVHSNGDIYPCGRYYPEEYRLGNIMDFNDLHDVFETKIYKNIINKSAIRKQKCREQCNVYHLCNGGCLNESILAGGIENIPEFSCTAFSIIISHIKTRMQEAISRGIEFENIYNKYIRNIIKKRLEMNKNVK